MKINEFLLNQMLSLFMNACFITTLAMLVVMIMSYIIVPYELKVAFKYI